MGFVLSLQVSLDRSDIFTILNLPFQERRGALCLFRSLKVALSNASYFLV